MQAPVDRLTDDILCDIFMLCLPERRWRIRITPDEAPLLLTSISRRWRAVAIGHALLWSWMRFSPRWRRLRQDDAWMEMFTNILDRARSAPLHLQLFPTRYIHAGDTQEARVPQTQTIPRLIVPFARSLTRLTLANVPLSNLQALPPGIFQALERLTINNPSNVPPLSPGSVIMAFSDAPSLQHVALGSWSDCPVYALRMLQLPLSQITRFLDTSWGNRGMYFLQEFLPLCTKLEYLSTELRGRDVGSLGQTVGASRYQLETLKSLNLTFGMDLMGNGGVIQYPQFFDNVDFPNLESLLLDAPFSGLQLDDESVWPPAQLDAFLAKLSSLENLHYLSLSIDQDPDSEIEVDPDALVQLFRATPRLTTLDIKISTHFDELFRAMNTNSPRYSDVLPSLQTLILEVYAMGWPITIDRGKFNHHFLEPRVLQRGPGRRPIQKVVLYANEIVIIPDEEDLGIENNIPFVIDTLQSAASKGLVEFELRVVRREGSQYRYAFNRGSGENTQWLERDPGLYDWVEASIYPVC